MKQKASLLLMEQLVMILVFALAAALCLQVFGKAEAIAGEAARLDQAVILARNGAELLKAGNPEAAEALGEDGFDVTVRPLPSRQPGLARARVEVSWEDALLYSLETGWQEVLP